MSSIKNTTSKQRAWDLNRNAEKVCDKNNTVVKVECCDYNTIYWSEVSELVLEFRFMSDWIDHLWFHFKKWIFEFWNWVQTEFTRLFVNVFKCKKHLK